ncbi:hypothetical protein PV08_08473 [Exophiala spinifera]|uniref:Rhodopsin domain-containing protein n=1 Tax=Exophiala spinifera TaxID=91928 RepID=A0A0D2B3N2_9EURO|nr:uncharacterized protein PV08_08473 [Exophiala spinifera]KIW13285.1 hypothetical protein PV08_08473 [Exophiala spinifera]
MVPDRGPTTSAVTIFITALATLFIAGRFYTRILLVKSVKHDDWWILAAWVLAVGFSASICIAVKYGLGKHKDDISDEHFASLRKAEYAFSILYNPALMLTKTSIIVFFLSVMSKDADPVFKWCNWLTLVLVNAVGTALTFYNIFQCRPVAQAWIYPRSDGAKCADIVTLYLSSAPVNIITDIALLVLPMPILTGMRLPFKQKLILLLTFSAGAFVAAVDVVRIAYLQNAALNRLKLVKTEGGSGSRIVEENDFSWYASLSFMWSAVEVCTGIVCACVPSLKPLFLRFLPRMVRDAGDTQNDDDNTSVVNAGVPNGNISMLNNPAAFRQAQTREYRGIEDSNQMGFLDMLAQPADEDTASISRVSTRLSRRSTTRTATSDFGFVKTYKRRNMLRLSTKESIWPVAVITVIFFLWGLAYGFLSTLNSRFQEVAKLSTGQGVGLHSAYYAGYLVGPLTLGRFILKRYGFKACMISGLCVYGCGTLVFWPSAVLTSYAAFVISNFIVGVGLSCLEIAANPYTSLCGPLEYAEVRLNISQAFQAIGTVCSPLLATRVLFNNVLNAPSLVNVQWTYLGIALFDFALAVVFFYIPLPEATDEQLDEQADYRSAVYRAPVGPWKVVYVTLAFGVFSQWCYVGQQECIGVSIQPLIQLVKPHTNLDPFDFETVGHTVFMAGRFLTAFLDYFFKPRWVLLGLFVGLIVCLGLQMHLVTDAAASVAMLSFLFEAGIFSNIFATSMRGLGRHTKTGSAFMTAAISGGAVFPPIMWAVSNARGTKYAYSVPLAAAVSGMIFPIYLNLVPAARSQVDPEFKPKARRHPLKNSNQNTSNFDDTIRDPRAVETYGKMDQGISSTNYLENHPEIAHLEKCMNDESLETHVPPVFTFDFADGANRVNNSQPLRSGPRKGYVGQLALWPDDNNSEGSQTGQGAQGQQQESEDASAQDSNTTCGREVSERHHQREGLDDYHTIMRQV